MITYDPLIRLIPIPFREKRNLVSEAIRETLHSGRGQPPEFHAPWLHNIHKQPIRRIRNDWNEYKKNNSLFSKMSECTKDSVCLDKTEADLEFTINESYQNCSDQAVTYFLMFRKCFLPVLWSNNISKVDDKILHLQMSLLS